MLRRRLVVAVAKPIHGEAIAVGVLWIRGTRSFRRFDGGCAAALLYSPELFIGIIMASEVKQLGLTVVLSVLSTHCCHGTAPIY